MTGFLSDDVKITKVKAAVAAGTTSQVSSILDMAGYDGVLFLASFGTAAANNGLKAQEGADSGMSDSADLAGTSVLSDGTATQVLLDLQRPVKRYVTCTALRGTSSTLESMWAIQYKARSKPVTNTTTAQLLEKWLTPAEGTA